MSPNFPNAYTASDDYSVLVRSPEGANCLVCDKLARNTACKLCTKRSKFEASFDVLELHSGSYLAFVEFDAEGAANEILRYAKSAPSRHQNCQLL